MEQDMKRVLFFVGMGLVFWGMVVFPPLMIIVGLAVLFGHKGYSSSSNKPVGDSKLDRIKAIRKETGCSLEVARGVVEKEDNNKNNSPIS